MKSQSGEFNVHLILTVFLGMGMLFFGGLAVAAYRDSTSIHATLDSRTAAAAKSAADTQKAIDTVAAQKADELPYRTYTASPIEGGFTLQIPKSWSIYAQHSANATPLLDLIANPDVVNVAVGGVNTQNFELKIVTTSVQSVVKTYSDQIKSKKLTSSGTTVSGIAATRFEGAIDTLRHDGVVIVFPVRDKTMIIKTDSHDFINEFNTIVASAHITP